MIIIEVLKNEYDDSRKEVIDLKNNGAFIIESKAFQGAPEMVQILLDITEKVLPCVVTFVLGYLEAKRYVSIKQNGIEVTGLKKENAEEVLSTLMNSDVEKANALKIKAEAEKIKADAEKTRAEAEKITAEAEKIKAETEKTKVETVKMSAEMKENPKKKK